MAEPLKAQFDPWLSDLKDLQKYLSNDLTISGVDAAKSLFAKTQAEGLENIDPVTLKAVGQTLMEVVWKER